MFAHQCATWLGFRGTSSSSQQPFGSRICRTSPDLDAQQASTVLATTRADVPTLEASMQTAIHRLGVLLGTEPGTLQAELTSASPIPVQPPMVPVGLPLGIAFAPS
ncbi:hypothetical protein SBV1_1450039 [Verrucomicrobia bacterium]|nr:hypothetical protein SBV1_1450039 [Verrucomicrobiota bacterium]